MSTVSPSRCAQLLAATLAFHGTLQVLAIALGLLGVPLSAAAALAVLMAAIAAALLVRKYVELPALPTVAPSPPTVLGERLATAVIAAAALVYAALWLVALTSREWSWDGNVYHVPVVHLWSLHGGIHWCALPPSVPGDPALLHFRRADYWFNGHPKAAEVLTLVLVSAGGPRFTLAATLLLAPLGVLGIARLAEHGGTRPRIAWAAGGMWLLVPTNIFQCNATYVDTAFGSCVVALLAAQADVLAASITTGRTAWPLAVLGAAAGLVLGTKGNGPVVVVLVLALLLVAVGVARRRQAQRPELPLCRTLGWLAAATTVAVLVGGFWNVRNTWMRGNPLYPVEIRLAGRTLVPGMSLADAVPEAWALTPEIGSKPVWQRVLLAWAQTGRGVQRQGIDSRQGGLGFVWLLGCVPALGCAACSVGTLAGRRLRVPWAMLLLSIGVCFLLQPLPWWARFTVWLHAAGLPCFAWAWSRVADGGGNRLAGAWIAGCVLIAVAEGAYCTLAAAAGGVSWQSGPVAETRRLVDAIADRCGRHARFYLLAELQGTPLEPIVRGNAAVIVNGLRGDRAPLLGMLCQPLGRRDLLLLPDPAGPSVAEFLQRHDTVYVIQDETLPLAEPYRRRCVAAWTIDGMQVCKLQARRGSGTAPAPPSPSLAPAGK